MEANRHFMIDCGIYTQKINVFFGESDYMLNKVSKFLNKESFEEFKNFQFYDGCSIKSPEGYFILWFKKLPKCPETISIIAHEIFHATIEVNRICGNKLSRKSEESFAYLNQYLTKQIFENI